MKSKNSAIGYTFGILIYILLFFLFFFLGLHESRFLIRLLYFIVAAIQFIADLIFFYFYFSLSKRRRPRDLLKDGPSIENGPHERWPE